MTAFRYQISPWLLASGIACLSIMTAALSLGLLDGQSHSPLWWIVLAILAALLILTSWATVLLRRASPIEVRVLPDHIELPDGPLGTHALSLPYTDLQAVRIMTRPALVQRTRARQLLYLLRPEQKFSLLMSDLFNHHDDYLACRAALCDAARRVQPDLPIELDGEAVEDLARLQRSRDGL